MFTGLLITALTLIGEMDRKSFYGMLFGAIMLDTTIWFM